MSALERICYIDSTIRQPGGVRLSAVADRFETSERQVERDMEYMRDRLNIPLKYVRERGRYEYTERYTALTNIDEKALLFYVFARAAAGTLAYVPVTERAGLQSLRDSIPKALRPLAERIRYELPDFEPPEEETVEKYRSGSYGVFKGPDAQSVVIRFYGWARSVVEREVWHPDQKQEEGADPVRGPWIQLTLHAFRFEELLAGLSAWAPWPSRWLPPPSVPRGRKRSGGCTRPAPRKIPRRGHSVSLW